FRLEKATPVTTPTTPPKAGKESPPKKETPESLEDVFDALLDRFGSPGRAMGPLSRFGSKPVKSKDGVPGKMWLWTPAGADVYAVFATWKKGDVELGIWIQCDLGLRRKYEVGFA